MRAIVCLAGFKGIRSAEQEESQIVSQHGSGIFPALFFYALKNLQNMRFL